MKERLRRLYRFRAYSPAERKFEFPVHFEKPDLLYLSVTALLLLAVIGGGWLLLGVDSIPLTAFVCTVTILIFMVAILHSSEAHRIYHGERIYRQIESLFSLFASLDIKHPLPPMRRWAISPDFANLLVATINTNKPRLTVEFGSGVSTVICGYALQSQGKGTLISIEHDATFAKKTQQQIIQHGLRDIVTVVHSPITEVDVKGEKRSWYDPNALKDLSLVDLLIVDGPPVQIQNGVRYPALPMMYDRLSEQATILLDDAERSIEQDIARRWAVEFSLTASYIDLEKGAFVFRRTTS